MKSLEAENFLNSLLILSVMKARIDKTTVVVENPVHGTGIFG